MVGLVSSLLFQEMTAVGASVAPEEKCTSKTSTPKKNKEKKSKEKNNKKHKEEEEEEEEEDVVIKFVILPIDC